MAPKMKSGDVQYYVLAENMSPLGSYPFWTDSDGHQRVTMNPKAAQWYIDQGALGQQPLDDLPMETQHAIKSMHGSARTHATRAREKKETRKALAAGAKKAPAPPPPQADASDKGKSARK